MTIEIPIPASSSRHALVELSATPWKERRTGGRELGVTLRGIALDGREGSLDADISWGDTGFAEKNTLVHRSLDLWWVRCFYSDLPRFLLVVPVGLALVAAAALAGIVRAAR